MRILAIRGAGLASLGAPFEIDFSREPLAGTGLFAITGETGAGKSTILDAMCLALYGRYPRVAIELNESVPDPSGKPLTAKDARGILRRGAAQGWAEVDFLGQDGVACRARWFAARARGKADGTPQRVQRLISRIDDGAALAEGSNAVEAEIVRRTGLTFEQFRRTVLLAQGEFDAFLLSPEGARAELLEKITGTDIYARVSIRVFEGTKQRQDAIARLQDRRDQIGLMAPEARASLLDEKREIASAVAAKTTEAEARSRRIAHAQAVANAVRLRTQAQAGLTAAQDAFEAAGADRAQLDALSAVAPLRAPAETLQRAIERTQAAAAEDTEAARLAEAAGLRLAAAAAAAARASEAFAAAEAAHADAEPVWRQADALDQAVATAGRELNAAIATEREAAQRVAVCEAARIGVDERLVAARASARDLEARLRARDALAPLADRAEEIAAQVKRAGELRQKAADAQAARERAEAEAAHAAASLAALERERDAEETRRKDLRARLSARADALAQIDEAAVRVRDERLAALNGRIAETRPLVMQLGERRRARSEAEAARDASLAAAGEAHRLLQALEGERQGLAASRREMQSLVDLAGAVMSRSAVELRSALVAGQPCPVCGGAEHPFAHAGHAEAALVAQVRTRRAALDAQLDDLAQRVEGTRRAHAEAEGRVAHAARIIEDAERDVSALVRELAERGPQLCAAAEVSGLAAGEPDSELTDAKLLAWRAELEQERAALGPRLIAATKLRGEIDALRDAEQKLAQAIDPRQAELTRLMQCHHEQAQIAVAQRVLADQLTEQMGAVVEALRPALAVAGLSEEDLARDSSRVAQRLAAIGAEQMGMRARLEAARAEEQRLEREAETANADARVARDAVTSAAAVSAKRRAELDQHRRERAELLCGEATDTHRNRVRAALAAARGALDGALAEQTHAQSHRAAMASRAGLAASALSQSVAERDAAEAAFAAAVHATGIARDAVQQLLAVAPQQLAALSDRVAGLERAIADARLSLEMRHRDLEALTADGRAVADLEAESALAAAAEQEMAGLRDRLAAVRHKIAADDEAGAKARTLAEAIEAASREAESWAAVNEAIGSSDGKRFRVIAQAVTLDQLVALANRELEALVPRYRLRRSPGADLAVHVVDHDMGEEERTVRSLSGGERFLVSLALALALSGLEGRHSFVDTLFIDEGFGTLDAQTLDVAIDALERLQGSGRKVGVITHVAAMVERIAVQVRVESRGAGRSVVRVVGLGEEAAALAANA